MAESFPVRTEQPDQPAIAAIGLTRRYGDFVAAQDMSFSVMPDEIFGLLGPNGAGKSTTFRMLCGLTPPTTGRGTVAGRDLATSRAEARQALGYMPQTFSLYADLTVAANLKFVAGAYGLTGKAQRLALDCVIVALGLEPYLKFVAGVLPLGIKQKLALGAAVLHTPPVLFLDEPTSGVDPLVRREFWHHINAIVARGTAVLVTTHFMDEAENCDRLLVINRAQTIAQSSHAAWARPSPTGSSWATRSIRPKPCLRWGLSSNWPSLGRVRLLCAISCPNPVAATQVWLAPAVPVAGSILCHSQNCGMSLTTGLMLRFNSASKISS